MLIIISPAKKMNVNTDVFPCQELPAFLDKTQELLDYMQSLDYSQCKTIWKCNDKIAELNYRRFSKMNLEKSLTPAILSYEGIQYQYMAPAVMEEEAFAYLQEHLRILSGFYGILKPFDGVVPYRLEMQAKMGNHRQRPSLGSLYEFWGSALADALFEEDQFILNLASKEYSKCISRYLRQDIRFITCVFAEVIGDKVVEKGTLAKMARGEMVRYLAKNQVEDMEGIKGFNRLGYHFSQEYSDVDTLVFILKQDRDAETH